MHALARLAVNRPVAVSVVAAALVVLGWTAWGNLPLDLLPDLQSPTVVISVRSGDRPPAEMERIYGEIVEQRLFAVSGIREIEQVARTGRIIATVGFQWETDMDFALVEVEKAVGPLRADQDVDEVVVRRFDPRQVPVVTLGLLPEQPGPNLAELRQIARRQIATALERLEGVAEVRVTGGRDRELRVEADRYKLDAFNMTLSELEGRLQQANVDINAGTLEEGSRVFMVRGLSRYRHPDDVAAVVVRYDRDAAGNRIPIRVADVAEVGWADRDVRHLVRVNGAEGVGLSIFKEAGANTVAVSKVVRDALDDLAGDLPGIEVSLISDEAALVVDSIDDVRQSALIGILLAVLVLSLFLRAAGPTVIVAVAVPVSLLTTLFLMHFGEQSLNVMTLGGLALGAGMLVDNAIVVVESIFRRLSLGDSIRDAAIEGTASVFGAITASTLTTCAVFLPIIFVRGLAARLIGGLSFTVVVSLLVSLFVALFLIPALARWLLPRGGVRAVDPGIGRTERVVALLLRRPTTVVVVALLLAGLAGWSLSRLGTELLPPSDPRQFSVRLIGPPGQRVQATERVVAAVEALIRQAAGEDVAAIMSEVGRLPEDDRLIQEEQTEENTARIVVRLREASRSGTQIVTQIEPLVGTMSNLEAQWEVGTTALARALGTTGPPIAIEISGQSLTDLREASETLREGLSARPELWNVRSSFEGGPPELRVVLERALADGRGVDLESIGGALEAALDGRFVTTIASGDEEYDIMLTMPRVRRDELLQIPFTTAGGQRIVVGDVARVEQIEGAREIFRRDQRRVAQVTARIAEGAGYPAATAAALQVVEELAVPPGLRVRVTGEEEERARTFGELRWAAGLALLLVFMVLAGTFESLIHPLTVVASVPLALIGVAAVLIPLGRPIGVMELLGTIVLAGVAVNNSILLLDAARQLIAEGVDRADALARAAGQRLRPILMTTATTILALLPLALAGGEASELRSPMARTIIGGLIASTLASLLVIPSLYLVLDRLRPRWGKPS